MRVCYETIERSAPSVRTALSFITRYVLHLLPKPAGVRAEQLLDRPERRWASRLWRPLSAATAIGCTATRSARQKQPMQDLCTKACPYCGLYTRCSLGVTWCKESHHLYIRTGKTMWRTSPSPQKCEDVTNVSTCSQRPPEKATGATCPSHTPSSKTQGYSEKCYFLGGGLRCECARPQCASMPSLSLLSLSLTHTPVTSTAFSRYSLTAHKYVLCQCAHQSRGISRIPLLDATTPVSGLSMLVMSARHGESTES